MAQWNTDQETIHSNSVNNMIQKVLKWNKNDTTGPRGRNRSADVQ